jgi:hypothetical protein
MNKLLRGQATRTLSGFERNTVNVQMPAHVTVLIIVVCLNLSSGTRWVLQNTRSSPLRPPNFRRENVLQRQVKSRAETVLG